MWPKKKQPNQPPDPFNGALRYLFVGLICMVGALVIMVVVMLNAIFRWF